jgi:mannitol 2-dehydrogenase
MAHLSNEVLGNLPKDVEVPVYDRSKVTPGIVHFGVGGFHRSHQAFTIDNLLAQGLAQDWGIIGVGLLKSDEQMLAALEPQDCLYTLVTKFPSGLMNYRVIGSIISYLHASQNPQAVLDWLSKPEIRIVSLTITEGGYSFDRVTGEFDPTAPGVAEDLHGSGTPVSAFGYIVEGLRLRRELGIAPFTVQSCDNIQSNGDVAKKMIIEFARYKDPELAEWIRANVAFPNAMVDRITPATSPQDISSTSAKLGVADNWPVPCEPFFQWVIEDHFPQGRPPYEKANVQMVDDVAPYELMKLRLLNASHQGLCFFSHLIGYKYVHEAMEDPLIVELLRKYMDEEATPTLLPVPGADLDDYKSQIIARFSNGYILDTIARLAAESSDRIPKFILPVVHELLKANLPVRLSAAIIASWARYAEAIDEQGNTIEVVDPLKEQLIAIAKNQRKKPAAFIENEAIFGLIAEDPRFSEPYLLALNLLHSDGAQKTLRNILLNQN